MRCSPEQGRVEQKDHLGENNCPRPGGRTRWSPWISRHNDDAMGRTREAITESLTVSVPRQCIAPPLGTTRPTRRAEPPSVTGAPQGERRGQCVGKCLSGCVCSGNNSLADRVPSHGDEAGCAHHAARACAFVVPRCGPERAAQMKTRSFDDGEGKNADTVTWPIQVVLISPHSKASVLSRSRIPQAGTSYLHPLVSGSKLIDRPNAVLAQLRSRMCDFPGGFAVVRHLMLAVPPARSDAN